MLLLLVVGHVRRHLPGCGGFESTSPGPAPVPAAAVPVPGAAGAGAAAGAAAGGVCNLGRS